MDRLFSISISLLILVSSFLAYGVVNGAGCGYQITNIKPDIGRETYLTCYRGKFVALHYHFDELNKLMSTWKVEGRQFAYGKQIIYFVYTRERVQGGDIENATDRYNRMSQAYRMLFYHFERDDNTIYIFQSFPQDKLIVGNIKGRLTLNE